MSVTPEIKTKFSLDGVNAARGQFGRLAQAGRASADRIKQAARNVLAPMKKDIETARRDLRRLGTVASTVGRTGFAGLQRSSALAFRSIRNGALLAAGSITAIGAAAAAASRTTAQELDKIAKEARALGVSTEDLSILQFAAEHEGAPADEVVKGISQITVRLRDLRKEMEAGSGAFSNMAHVPDADLTSVPQMRQRMQELTEAMAYSMRRNQGDINAAYLQRIVILREMEKQALANGSAEEKLVYGLQQYGLDVEAALKGGVDGFVAFGDAIRQVQDPAERLHYAVALFGQQAGPRMLNLLLQGRAGIAEYRKEAERLGIVVDSQLAGMSESFETSSTNFKQSMRGLRMEIARALLPDMTQTNNALAAWVAGNRKAVTTMFRQGLDSLKNFAMDVFDLLNGNGGRELRTPWLQSLRAGVAWVHQTWRGFRSDVEALMGRGQAQNFPWLQVLGDGIWSALDLAKDFWDILQGRDATSFPWLNTLRDEVLRLYAEAVAWITDFAARFKVAFDAFMDVVEWIREKLQSFLNLFGFDVTTTLLFLGLMKVTGILSLAIGSLKVILGLFSGVAASAGLTKLAAFFAGLSGNAAAGAMAGAAITKAGAAGAGGAGAAAVGGAAAAGGGRLAGLLRGPAGRLGAVGVGGAALGYAAYEGLGFGTEHRQRMEDLHKIIEMATARNAKRRNVEDYAQLSHNPLDLQKYWRAQGIEVSDAYVRWRQQATGQQESIYKRGMTPGDYAQAQRDQVTRTVKLDVTLGGEQFDFYGTPEQGDRLERAAAALERRRY